MSYKACLIGVALLGVVAVYSLAQASGSFYNLPQLPPADRYGSILIDRLAVKRGVKPVTFSHALHRARYTCRVCHSELEFNMKLNSTEITESANIAGKYCGACHNGTLAFGRENCKTCHTGEIATDAEKIAALRALPLVKSEYGDGINWVASLRSKAIAPQTHLQTSSREAPYDRELSLEAEWLKFAPAIFPHKAHSEWLACSNCHPEIFNIKKKTTRHFSMPVILKGEFCGVCHLAVAFPMNDCARCHPGMPRTQADKSTIEG